MSEGLGKIIEQRTGKLTVGFLRSDAEEEVAATPPKEDRTQLQKVLADDLVRFGLIPEFIGRLPVVAVMDPLGVDDMVHVMTEPKNALVKQYQKLLKFEGVDLRFTEGALTAIAERAVGRRSGARGLRAVMESVMLDIMFDIPSQDGVRELTITEDVVRSGGEPTIRRLPEVGEQG